MKDPGLSRASLTVYDTATQRRQLGGIVRRDVALRAVKQLSSAAEPCAGKRRRRRQAAGIGEFKCSKNVLLSLRNRHSGFHDAKLIQLVLDGVVLECFVLD